MSTIVRNTLMDISMLMQVIERKTCRHWSVIFWNFLIQYYEYFFDYIIIVTRKNIETDELI